MILVFRGVPGLLIVRFSEQLAERLFPSEASTASPVSPQGLYVVGATLLSFYFLILGAAGIVGAVISLGFQIFSEYGVWELYVANLGSSAVRVALGAWLYSHALKRASESAA